VHVKASKKLSSLKHKWWPVNFVIGVHLIET
jgi:hypothetical protein